MAESSRVWPASEDGRTTPGPVWWLPFATVATVHLLAHLFGTDGVAEGSQVLLMPALAVVLFGVPRAARGPAWPWALGALAGSWVGDSLPRVVPEDAEFLSMVGGFTIAQVLWIVAFTRHRGSRPPLLYIVALVAAAVVLLALTAPAAGVLAPAIIVYGVILAATAYFAAGHGLLGAAGGALFVVSDGLIALGAFRREFVDWPARSLVVMSTYIAAQALLVAAVLRLRSRRAAADAKSE